MKTIWKYDLSMEYETAPIEMPWGAKVVAVQVQDGKPRLWAIVDPDHERRVRTFRVFGTGEPLTDDVANNDYVGTFQLDGGQLVFHVFEVRP